MNFLFWLLWRPTQTIFYVRHLLPIELKIVRNKAIVFAYDVAIALTRAKRRVFQP